MRFFLKKNNFMNTNAVYSTPAMSYLFSGFFMHSSVRIVNLISQAVILDSFLSFNVKELKNLMGFV
jgi:hypothetical protein